MNGAELAPGLLCAATGLALAFASTRRLLALGLAVLLASVLATSWTGVGAGMLETALAGCWISILGAALCVHLPRPLGAVAVLTLCCVGGVWAGLVVAAAGRPTILAASLPWALLCLPGASLVARGGGVAVKVVLSWLAAVAVLSLGLGMTPTLGYEPDHMG